MVCYEFYFDTNHNNHYSSKIVVDYSSEVSVIEIRVR